MTLGVSGVTAIYLSVCRRLTIVDAAAARSLVVVRWEESTSSTMLRGCKTAKPGRRESSQAATGRPVRPPAMALAARSSSKRQSDDFCQLLCRADLRKRPRPKSEKSRAQAGLQFCLSAGEGPTDPTTTDVLQSGATATATATTQSFHSFLLTITQVHARHVTSASRIIVITGSNSLRVAAPDPRSCLGGFVSEELQLKSTCGSSQGGQVLQ